MGVDAGRCVPYVEQRRCGGRGGVAQLLGGADSCRRRGRVGLRPDTRQLSVRCQVRAMLMLGRCRCYLPTVFSARLSDAR